MTEQTCGVSVTPMLLTQRYAPVEIQYQSRKAALNQAARPKSIGEAVLRLDKALQDTKAAPHYIHVKAPKYLHYFLVMIGTLRVLIARLVRRVSDADMT